MRRGLYLLGFALALLLPGGGCGSEGPVCGNCHLPTRNSLSFEAPDGTGSVDWDGNRPIFYGDPIPYGTCQASLQYDEPACVDSNAAPPMAFTAVVDCTRDDGSPGGFQAELGNVLELPPGVHQVTADGNATLAYLYNTTTVRTKQLGGSTAKYPAVVTPDFDEQVTVDVQSATFNATLHFEVTADRFHALPHQTCGGCPC